MKIQYKYLLNVISKEGPVEIEVKGKITISCIIRKLYRSCMRSLGSLEGITQSLIGNFLIKRGSISPGMRK